MAGGRLESADTMAGRAVAAAVRAERHAEVAASQATGAHQSVLRLREDVEQRAELTALELRQQSSRLTTVEKRVEDVPGLVAASLEELGTRLLKKYWRRFVGVTIGALGITGGASWLRIEQVNDKSVERVSATREDLESLQLRLYQEAIESSRAEWNRQLEAARIEELRRQAAAERAATMRDPAMGIERARRAVSRGNPVYEPSAP